ncbi:MAG: hypothetical protein FWE71_00005, partial [Nocardioidaceae bacterium]|nr:hypothetical protein [Nocardioidaceae bacterium]MCL2612746.1 hypothetical protein [Nocardioidaceae bacterium]
MSATSGDSSGGTVSAPATDQGTDAGTQTTPAAPTANGPLGGPTATGTPSTTSAPADAASTTPAASGTTAAPTAVPAAANDNTTNPAAAPAPAPTTKESTTPQAVKHGSLLAPVAAVLAKTPLGSASPLGTAPLGTAPLGTSPVGGLPVPGVGPVLDAVTSATGGGPMALVSHLMAGGLWSGSSPLNTVMSVAKPVLDSTPLGTLPIGQISGSTNANPVANALALVSSVLPVQVGGGGGGHTVRPLDVRPMHEASAGQSGPEAQPNTAPGTGAVQGSDPPPTTSSSLPSTDVAVATTPSGITATGQPAGSTPVVPAPTSSGVGVPGTGSAPGSSVPQGGTSSSSQYVGTEMPVTALQSGQNGQESGAGSPAAASSAAGEEPPSSSYPYGGAAIGSQQTSTAVSTQEQNSCGSSAGSPLWVTSTDFGTCGGEFDNNASGVAPAAGSAGGFDSAVGSQQTSTAVSTQEQNGCGASAGSPLWVTSTDFG